MVYLIIGLAMILVIGPIFWLRPSPRERELAMFRAKAFETGFKVQPLNVRTDKFYSHVLARNPHLADDQWVRYSRTAKEDEIAPDIREKWVQRKDREGTLFWEPSSVQSVPPENVQVLLEGWAKTQAEGVLALEFGPRTVSVVWNERGEKEILDVMLASVLGLFQKRPE